MAERYGCSVYPAAAEVNQREHTCKMQENKDRMPKMKNACRDPSTRRMKQSETVKCAEAIAHWCRRVFAARAICSFAQQQTTLRPPVAWYNASRLFVCCSPCSDSVPVVLPETCSVRPPAPVPALRTHRSTHETFVAAPEAVTQR